MVKRNSLIALFLLSIIVGLSVIAYLSVNQGISNSERINNNEIEVSSAMSSNEDLGFSKAVSERTFKFPEDHGIHQNYKVEWWYFTGNLRSSTQQEFGYQLTFFRNALLPDSQFVPRSSELTTNHLYMVHFALSDVNQQKFYSFEKFARENSQSAFVSISGNILQINVGTWKVYSKERMNSHQKTSIFPLIMEASGKTANGEIVSIEFEIDSVKSVVLQGKNGLSQKSSENGNASYYYSMTRLRTKGKIIIGKNLHEVEGDSWLDREWSTSALGKNQVGWDWFSLQLSNGKEVMYYQLRDKNGNADKYSSGVIIQSNSNLKHFSKDSLKIVDTEYWTNSAKNSSYPINRELIFNSGMRLKVQARIPNQELQTTVRYWEGTVSVSGIDESGKPISGLGYLEMTGYTSHQIK